MVVALREKTGKERAGSFFKVFFFKYFFLKYFFFIFYRANSVLSKRSRSFQLPGSLAIVWLAFSYTRPDHLWTLFETRSLLGSACWNY